MQQRRASAGNTLANTAINNAPATIQATVNGSTIVGILLEVVNRRIEHLAAR